MLLADGIVIFWVGALLVLGVLGFFAMAIVLVLRCIGHLFRFVFGVGGEGGNPSATGAGPREPKVCPHPRCGQINRRGARYCGRCGRPL